MPLTETELRAVRRVVESWLDDLARKAETLEQLSTVRYLQDHLDELLGKTVKRSRREGWSWTAIGEALGVSKQAARERFGPGSQWDVDRA